MTERDLLEAAAKAAGITIARWSGLHMAGGTVRAGLSTTPIPWVDGREWNPLTDDGDALRLAVKLRIDIDWDELEPRVEAYHKVLAMESHYCADECVEPDPAAATRRAIVRAAAALAKGMP